MQGQTKGKVFSLVAMFAGSAVIVVFVVLSKGQLPLRERSADHVFPPATGVLAQLELNGDVKDSSGNGRDARLMGGTFVPTRRGQGLDLGGAQTAGIDWSVYANLLTEPFSIEMVLTPTATATYAKLFGPMDSADEGWYYRSQGIDVYPRSVLAGPGSMRPNERHYLAFVSSGPGRMDVYFQGQKISTAPITFRGASHALFFVDDTQTGRSERVHGVVEALRISGVSRSPAEIAEVQRRLESPSPSLQRF